MSENKHTPEPWMAVPGGRHDPEMIITTQNRLDQSKGEICGADVEFTGPHGEEQKANIRRIVACVNACAGIPTETIEAVATDRQFWPLDLKGSSRKGLITLLGIQNFTVQGLKKQADSETRKKLKNQRDELLAALEKVTAKLAWLNSDDCAHIMALTDEAEVIIASVKGYGQPEKSAKTEVPEIVFYPAGSLGEEIDEEGRPA